MRQLLESLVLACGDAKGCVVAGPLLLEALSVTSASGADGAQQGGSVPYAAVGASEAAASLRLFFFGIKLAFLM